MFAFNICAPHPGRNRQFCQPRAPPSHPCLPLTLGWHLCKIPAENVVCGCWPGWCSWLVLWLRSVFIAISLAPTPSSLLVGDDSRKRRGRVSVFGPSSSGCGWRWGEGCYEKAISSHMHGGFALHSSPLWLGVVGVVIVSVDSMCAPAHIHAAHIQTHTLLDLIGTFHGGWIPP